MLLIEIIMKWMNNRVKAKWKLIEKQSTSNGTLPFLSLKEMHKNNWCVASTLTNWRFIQKMSNFDKECVYMREMVNDRDFLPSKMYTVLEGWAGNGLQLYSQLMTNNVLDHFDKIAKKK